MNNNNIEKLVPVFSAAFAVIYILSVQLNWALFTYHPKTGQWGWLVEPSRDGTPMYWYGWLVTSVFGAAAVSVITWPLLRNRPTQYWLGWTVPLLVMISIGYFFRGFFLR
jgi:hypothetical protein